MIYFLYLGPCLTLHLYRTVYTSCAFSSSIMFSLNFWDSVSCSDITVFTLADQVCRTLVSLVIAERTGIACSRRRPARVCRWRRTWMVYPMGSRKGNLLMVSCLHIWMGCCRICSLSALTNCINTQASTKDVKTENYHGWLTQNSVNS